MAFTGAKEEPSFLIALARNPLHSIRLYELLWTLGLYGVNKKPVKKLSRVLYGFSSRCQKGSMQLFYYITTFHIKASNIITTALFGCCHVIKVLPG
jgi:hypothetical protein